MATRRQFYGQSTSIANEIARNLHAYADHQTLAELTQNADDAGAKRVAFMLDARTHGTERLLHHSGGTGRLNELQGPALLAFDSAIFKEDDFSGLRAFGRGGKRYDPTKTGKFGLGFNSVYHLTEVPQFVSGEHMVLLDPQYTYLPGLSRAHEPGLQIHLPSEDRRAIADQLAPFHVPAFGCDMERSGGSFNGTLFRFPLRTEPQAEQSELRPGKPYTLDNVLQLFADFKQQAAELLLFLNFVECIELWIWEPTADKPNCVFKVESSGGNLDKRAELASWLRSSLDAWTARTGKPWKQTPTALMEILQALKHPERDIPRTLVHHNIHIHEHNQLVCTTSWWLRHGVGLHRAMAYSRHTTTTPTDRPLWPVGCVAARVSTTWHNQDRRKRQEQGTRDASTVTSKHAHEHTVPAPLQGRAFATLPTDVQTGYPVHVNARWCLMDNRQALQTSQAASHKRMSDFNRVLIQDTVAHLWVELLLELKRLNLDAATFYALWPDEKALADPWSLVTQQFYTRMQKAESCMLMQPSLSHRAKPQWRRPEDVYFDDISSGHLIHLDGDKRMQAWRRWAFAMILAFKAAQEAQSGRPPLLQGIAALPPRDRFRALARVIIRQLRCSGNIVQALAQDAFPITAAPPFVRDNFKAAGVPAQVTAPTAVAAFYRDAPLPQSRTPFENAPRPSLCNAGNVAAIVRFCLGERRLAKQQEKKSKKKNRAKGDHCLMGTPLLAMSDNTLAEFGVACHPTYGKALLSGSPHVVKVLGPVARSVIAHTTVASALLAAADDPLLNQLAVGKLDGRRLQALIEMSLPPDLVTPSVPIEWPQEMESHIDATRFIAPSREWLESFYAVLAVMVQQGTEKQDVLNIFENIPVVPACAHNHAGEGADGEYRTPTEYLATVPVAKACVLRYPRTADDGDIFVSETVSRVCDVASRCGVRFLLEDFLDARVLQLPFHTFSGSSLITALGEIHTYFKQQQQQPSPLERLSHKDVGVILRFLEQGADTLSRRDLNALKTLPLFEVDEPPPATAPAPPTPTNGTPETPRQGQSGQATVTSEHGPALSQRFIPIHDLPAPRELPARAWSEFLSDAKLLKSKASVCPNLYQRLGIKPLEEAEYYTLYVLPAVSRLTQQQRLRIMREINNSQRLLEDQTVLRAIRNTAFVRVASGDVVKPGEAYKPFWLFEKVFPGRVVRREDELREVWLLPFLERVGLITTVTRDVLVLAAREAAKERNKDVTDAILRFLSFHAETFADDTALRQQLSSIPFLYPNVPRDEALLSLLKAYDPRAWYAPKDIHIPTNRDGVHLVWSQVPMTVEKDRYTTMILQCVEPTPEMVAKHLRFCSQLNKDALYRFSAWLHHRDEEFLVSPCYRFFSRLLDTEPVAQVRELLSDGELALIVDRAHVDSATGRFRPRVFFVKASCVFDDLPQPGFPPFAYATSMLSRSMIEDKLLAAMGVRKSPTLQDLVRWLGKYAERAQGQPLPEETMRHVIRIFTMLETHEATIKAHNVTNHEGFCVLTADKRLMPGKFVVVDDAPWLRHRIDMSSVFPVHPRIASVSKTIGIHGLDQAVEERLHAGYDPETVRDNKPEISRQCATWQATLRSRQFRLAVLRIATHEQQMLPLRQHGGLDDMSAMPEVPGDDSGGAEAADGGMCALREKLIHLQAAEISAVTHVESQFFLRSTGNDVTLQPRGSPCLLAQMPTGGGGAKITFYLDTSVPRFKRLSALVMTINRFFGSKFHNLQALEKVIESPPDEVQATLDFLHVTKVSAEVLGEDSRTVEQGELERLVAIKAQELPCLRVGADVVIKQENGQYVYAVLTGVDQSSSSVRVELPDGTTCTIATGKLFRVMGVEEQARALRNAAVRRRLQSDAERATGTAEVNDGIERSAAGIIGENYDETKEQAEEAVRQEFKESLDAEPVHRVKYEPIDPEWREKEEQTINALKGRYEQLRNELEPEEPGVDELLVENGFDVPMPEDDPRLKDAGVEVSTRVRRGYDLVRIANIGGVAIFHARTAALAQHRLKLFEQCVQVLQEVSDVFSYDARFVTLFYQEQAQSRFIKQKLLYNIWPIEVHAKEHGVADVRNDPFAYMYFYGLHVHKLAHFHDIVHGTRHDYYMNELRVEFLEEWIELLEKKGFDPAALEMSELGERCLRHVVF